MSIGFRVTPMSVGYLIVTLALLYASYDAGGVLLSLAILGWGVALAYMVGRDVFTSASHALREQGAEHKKYADSMREYIRKLERKNAELSAQNGVQPTHEKREDTPSRSNLRRFLEGHGNRRGSAG